MKVIIAGGREVRSSDLVVKAITESGFFHDITELVSGGAPGVDKLGEAWAIACGVPITRFGAQWDLHLECRCKVKTPGSTCYYAGPRRNRQMAAYADALIAIPTGGPGTRNMIEEATKRGLKVFVWEGLLK